MKIWIAFLLFFSARFFRLFCSHDFTLFLPFLQHIFSRPFFSHFCASFREEISIHNFFPPFCCCSTAKIHTQLSDIKKVFMRTTKVLLHASFFLLYQLTRYVVVMTWYRVSLSLSVRDPHSPAITHDTYPSWPDWKWSSFTHSQQDMYLLFSRHDPISNCF